MLALATALAFAAAGCKSNPPSAAPPLPGDKPAAAVDAATLGTVEGIVRLAGKAPAPLRIDTSMDPACGLGGGDVYSEQLVVKGDRLANVYVYVKSGPGLALAQAGPSPQPVVLDQKGCVYTPHVLAVQVGQPVEFRNEDPTMHNIHTTPAVAGNPPIDISQGPRGAPQLKTFPQAEIMMPVRCNNHPWMNAFLNVSATPWFAVTGPDGRFELKSVPPGVYVIGAVQEKLGELEFKVIVRPQARTQADFTFAVK